ncbi:hypothetical protein [Xylocopilactobacillus apicola]|nr:hypothetical protein [Xylocopilactobacillus apicola]
MDNLSKEAFLLSENPSEDNEFVKEKNSLIEVGFSYFDIGLKPQIKMFSETKTVFFGINQKLECISYQNRNKLFSNSLSFPLYEILADSCSEFVVCICELEILVYKKSGIFLWKMGFGDIVDDYSLSDEKTIIVKTADGNITEFYLSSGKVK